MIRQGHTKLASCGLRSVGWPAPHLIASDRGDVPDFVHQSLSMFSDVISDAEHDSLVSQIHSITSRRRYEAGHWDKAISLYREAMRDIQRLENEGGHRVQQIARSIEEGLEVRLQDQAHLLDYHADGELKPHVDSVAYAGELIAGISLLSTRVMRFVHHTHPEKHAAISVLLPPKSLYLLRGELRFEWEHAILHPHQRFRGEDVPSQRRMTLVMREVASDHTKAVS